MDKATNKQTIINGINVHIPKAFNTGDGTVFGAIIDSISDRYVDYYKSIDRIDDLIGIDTTNGDELDRVWGKRIGIRRRVGESDQRYRNRMKTSVLKLYGGTASALRYATLIALNRDRYPYLDDDNSGVQIIDAKDYVGVVDIDRSPGNAIVQIDTGILDNMSLNEEEYDDLIDILDDVKASGVNLRVLLIMFDGDYVALRACTDEEWLVLHEDTFDYSDWNLILNKDEHHILSGYTVYNGYEDRLRFDDDWDNMIIKQVDEEDMVFADEPPVWKSITNDDKFETNNTFYVGNDQIIDK